jgi:hypothetical protein
VLEGSGGTVAVLTGSDGKVLIDAGIAVSRPQLTRALAVAAKPTAAFDAKFGNFVIDPGFFTRLVYEGV